MNLPLSATAIIGSMNAGRSKRWAVAGAVVAMSWLINSAAGVGTALAAFAMLGASEPLRPFRRPAGSVAWLAGSAVVAIAAFAGLGRLWSGVWPLDLSAPLGQTAVGGGLIGGRLAAANPATLAAVWVFVGASAEIASACFRRARRLLTAEESVRVFMAVFLLAWLVYFANRPANGWYLWSSLFVYAFLIPHRPPSEGEPWRIGGRWATASVLTLFLAPETFAGIEQVLRDTRARLGPTLDAACWSGVRVRPDTAALLHAKLDRIQAQSNSVVFLGAVTFSLPQESGRYAPLSVQDPYVETMRASDYQRLLEEIESLEPEVLLLEPRTSPFFYSERQAAFFDRLRTDLGKSIYRCLRLRTGTSGAGVDGARSRAPACVA